MQAPLTVGGLLAQLRSGDLLVVSGALLAALVFSTLGIVGGAISRERPKRSSTYLAVAGVGSLMVLSSLWLFFGPLFLAGAVLSWLGRPMESAQEPIRADPERSQIWAVSPGIG